MRKFCTLFCDIDGTLLKYRKFETYKTTIPDNIQTSIDNINKAYDENHTIVLTTARPEYLRQHTMKELDHANIKYHQLIMGLARGSRILINDNENKEINRTFAFNLERNKGFTEKQEIELNHILSK